METPETTPSFASKLQMVAMQTVVPAKVTDPGQRRCISGQTRPEMYKEHFHMVLYYNKAHEEEDGWVLTGWVKDSLSRSLSEEPMFAGRLQRSPDNNEGEMAIALNDSGVRLVNAQMEATVSEFLNSEERGDVEAQLAFWKDVDEQNPQYSALFYVQGVLVYHDEIVDYFNSKGVSAVFLFRRNLLSRMISILANNYDHDAKQLNGTHKSHVHSKTEANVLAKFKPTINITLLLPELERAEEMATNALNYFNKTRHIVLFYEDLVKNRTKLQDVQDFLNLPRRELESRQVKIHTHPLSKQVSNWDDVCEKLKGTKYERFLKGT